MLAASVTSHPALVRELQEKAARALPVEHVEQVGGWWLRHSDGHAWWIATVLPHTGGGRDELEGRVAVAERFYADHGTTARFQISPGACPDLLDTLLIQRGYCRESPVSLRVAATTQVRDQAPTGSVRVRLDDEPADDWFDVWHAVLGHAGDRRIDWDMLRRVRRPSAYASAMLSDEIVGVGRAVVDGDWAGVFSMATLPQARGQGAGGAVLAALAGWSAAHRAEHLYLQVEADNSAALRLYDGAGFGELCGYHYRTET